MSDARNKKKFSADNFKYTISSYTITKKKVKSQEKNIDASCQRNEVWLGQVRYKLR